MDGDESGLNSYYHHNHNQHHHHHTAAATPGTNGLFSNPHHHHPHHFTTTTTSSSEPTPPSLVFPQQHSVVTGRAPIASSTPPPPPPPPETVRRKRGRPRKYGTSESSPQSATASTSSAKNNSKLSNNSNSAPSVVHPSSPRKKEPLSAAASPTSSKKAQLLALGNAGQGFTPHVITVAAGEDVAQKIMSFTQQRKRAVCILSASGSISNASLRQPATLGGNVTYEGRFEILSLSGSFLHNEIGGSSSRTGGLSVCLSGTDGRIVGGGVGGPLKAAGPVQVIAGSFVFDAKNEVNADSKIETSASKLPPGIVGSSLSGIGFRSIPDSSGRNSVRNDDHQHIVANSFMLQPRGMHLMPSRQNDWRSGLDGRSSSTNIELAGTTDLESCHSPEDGDDEHLQD